jgi:hypothetical protein
MKNYLSPQGLTAKANLNNNGDVNVNDIVNTLNQSGQTDGKLVIKTSTILNNQGRKACDDLRKKGWKIEIYGRATI